MAQIPGGGFPMGSDAHYPEERPKRTATIAPFSLATRLVTNAEFAAFVDDTGYLTTAELPLEGPEFESVPEAERAPGSLCFTPADGPVNLRNWRSWWRWQPGATWRRPQGPGSTIDEMADHPVVHVSFADAAAYASWAGARLPTEPEWERAGWAGARDQEFAWGSELTPGGVLMANTWQGKFPYHNTGARGWTATSPVGSFPASDYGLFDMIGNVWEWTTTLYLPGHAPRNQLSGSSAGPAAGSATPPACGCSPTRSRPDPNVTRVVKGGSHLCAPEYCQRYRPAARTPQTEDSATNHLGFRIARDL